MCLMDGQEFFHGEVKVYADDIQSKQIGYVKPEDGKWYAVLKHQFRVVGRFEDAAEAIDAVKAAYEEGRAQ